MPKIPMVDLLGQYHKIKPEVDKAIEKVLETTAFINGEAVKHFQNNLENYLDTKHVIPCGNGTDALQISMMALGLKPGDEIITPSFTFIATAEVIALLGLKPVFVDVNIDTFTVDTIEIGKKITSKTKAIIPVHLFGQSSNMEEIMRIADKYNLFVIEDTCQAIGADYTFSNGEKKKVGTIGNIGCVSFFPSKNLGAFGDGGAIFTDNDELAKKCRSIVNHGMTKRYYHDNIGVNSRLDTIQAAILDVKLKHLDEYAEARQKAANYYNNAFADIPQLATPVVDKKSSHVYHQYTLVTKNIDRDELVKFIHSKDISAAVYYPVPVHLQEAYKHYGHKMGALPITEDLSKRVISLPIHTEMTEDLQDEIINAVKEFIRK
ncbi:MAG: DegT/DnrJ/EryC1/StrS family aminotransferase [Bacteroidota bacterium]|nr:DegT/DnrJ/EryC1/StrS family aminotransferase [Bacteroidota bacterium]